MNILLILFLLLFVGLLITFQWLRGKLNKAQNRLKTNDLAYSLLMRMDNEIRVYRDTDVIEPEKGMIKIKNSFVYANKHYNVTANVEIDHFIERQNNPLKKNELKEVFISNVGHRMRTSLQGIVGFSSLLMDEGDYEQVKTYASEIKSNSELMLRFVNSLINRSMQRKDNLN